MGAVGEDGVRVLNEEVVRRGRRRPRTELAAVEQRERAEVERRGHGASAGTGHGSR